MPKHGEPAYPIESYGDGWSQTAAVNANIHDAIQQEIPPGALQS